jgi:tetratricopeptide (TPR) repeat protein
MENHVTYPHSNNDVGCFLKPAYSWLYKLTLIAFLLFSSGISLDAYAGRYTIAVQKQINIFKPVASLPASQRIDTALYIYKVNCRKIPVANAMGMLDSLTLLARNIGDQPLECAVYEMRADYYSVNYGFNATGVYYYNQAVNYAQKHQLKLQEGFYIHKKALYYALFKHNTAACQYFLDAQEVFNNIGYSGVPDIAIYLWDFAVFYYSIGDYAESRVYLNQALRYNIPRLRDKINITNTIGLIYRNYEQYPQALSVFAQVLNMATIGKDTAWIGIANGNIGSVYFMQKHYSEALPYIQTDYEISLKYQETLNAAIALLRLAHISLATNHLKQAELQIIHIGQLLHQEKTNVLKYQTDLYQLEAMYDERTGNLKQALASRQKYETLKDSLIKQDNIAAVDRVSLQWQKDKHLMQLNQIKANTQIATTQMAFIIALLILLLAASVIMYRRRILRIKKDKEILLSEKSNVDEDLKNATAALTIYTKSLKNKNEIIEQFRKKIEQLQIQVHDEVEIEKLNNLVQTHIMTDETWNEFKKLFSKVHTKFFYNLAANYPKISVTDTRLLSLIKLGLNNREMSNMLGITVEGIKKAKQRLRKKMGLSADEDIDEAIAKF